MTCGNGSDTAYGSVNCNDGKCTCLNTGNSNSGLGYCGSAQDSTYFPTPGNTTNCNYEIDDCHQCNGNNYEKDCLGTCQYESNGDENGEWLG